MALTYGTRDTETNDTMATPVTLRIARRSKVRSAVKKRRRGRMKPAREVARERSGAAKPAWERALERKQGRSE